MSNADMPAMPQSVTASNNSFLSSFDVPHAQGLTKREQFAMTAMQGLCADHNIATDKIPKLAAEVADALLAELEKKEC